MTWRRGCAPASIPTASILPGVGSSATSANHAGRTTNAPKPGASGDPSTCREDSDPARELRLAARYPFSEAAPGFAFSLIAAPNLNWTDDSRSVAGFPSAPQPAQTLQFVHAVWRQRSGDGARANRRTRDGHAPRNL